MLRRTGPPFQRHFATLAKKFSKARIGAMSSKRTWRFRFDALADAIAIFTVPDELNRERNVIFLRSSDQLLQSHPLQDAARQPATQKAAFRVTIGIPRSTACIAVLKPENPMVSRKTSARSSSPSNAGRSARE